MNGKNSKNSSKYFGILNEAGQYWPYYKRPPFGACFKVGWPIDVGDGWEVSKLVLSPLEGQEVRKEIWETFYRIGAVRNFNFKIRNPKKRAGQSTARPTYCRAISLFRIVEFGTPWYGSMHIDKLNRIVPGRPKTVPGRPSSLSLALSTLGWTMNVTGWGKSPGFGGIG